MKDMKKRSTQYHAPKASQTKMPDQNWPIDKILLTKSISPSQN